MPSSEYRGESFEPGDEGLVRRFGPVDIETVRSFGYFGGIAAAIALDIIDWPVGLFIAAIPFVKMLNRRDAPRPVRVASQVFEGMALPVGGDARGTVRLADTGTPRRRRQVSRSRRRPARPSPRRPPRG